MKEIWIEINGYKISNYGKIIGKRGKELNGCITKWGYKGCSVDLGEGYGRVNNFHRVIAMAFIPNLENKPEVNHIDGDKLNNHVDNLEWVSKEENQKHASHVLKKRAGKYNYHVKITEEIVLQIYNACKNSNKTYKDIAKEFNVAPDCVRRIANGVTWKYLELDPLGNIKDKPVIGINIYTGEIKRYRSSRFAKEDGFLPHGISGCCTGRQKIHRGYKWSYDQ